MYFFAVIVHIVANAWLALMQFADFCTLARKMIKCDR